MPLRGSEMRNEVEVSKVKDNAVAVMSVAYDASSSFLKGAAQGPRAILDALHSPSTNMCCESGVDLGSDPRWWIAGEVCPSDAESAVSETRTRVSALLDDGSRVVTLGGDHFISYPLVSELGERFPELTVLHLDAHPDLYDALDGDRYSHACPFARVMEEGSVSRLVQVGVRTMNPHQREQSDRFGVEVVEMKAWNGVGELKLAGPLYLSIDLDCLDPAFAPGVSHHEPGGMTTREIIAIIQSLPSPLVGADIVELNPERDLNGVTAMVGAKLLKEVVSKMLAEGGDKK